MQLLGWGVGALLIVSVIALADAIESTFRVRPTGEGYLLLALAVGACVWFEATRGARR